MIESKNAAPRRRHVVTTFALVTALVALLVAGSAASVGQAAVLAQSTSAATAPATAPATTTSTVTPTVTLTPVPQPTAQPAAVPQVFAVKPAFGSVSGGTKVTISGGSFAAGATVMFGAAAATSVVVVDGGTITAMSPAQAAGPVGVTVTNPGGQSGSLASAFEYVAPPTISSFSPGRGSSTGGDFVSINGTGLDKVSSVQFGSASDLGLIYASSSSQMSVRTPPHAAGAVTITLVDIAGGSVNSSTQFTFISSATATAQAQATQSAVAQATANANATQTAVASAAFATATAVASQPGRSSNTAIPLPVGGSVTGTLTSNVDMVWYSMSVEAGRVYRVSNACTGAESSNYMYLWQLQAGVLVNIAVQDAVCGITVTAPATTTLYVSTGGLSGTSYTMQLVQFNLILDTPTATPIIPTATATVTPTPTATERPVSTGDGFEPDDTPGTASTITVGGATQTHTFHSSLDVDHVKFTTVGSGSYVIRTSNMAGGAQTLISLLNGTTGAVVADATTGQSLTSFADDATGEIGAARIRFNASGADANATFVVRVVNANPDKYGTDVTYQVRVENPVAFTATPTVVPNAPTNTPTRTVTPTRTPASGDAYEDDGSRALADAHVINLVGPLLHAGTGSLSSDRLNGPSHTFHTQGDEDWLALQLPALVPNSQLQIRAFDVTRRGELRTQPQMFLYRTSPGTGALQLLRRVENCTDIGGQPTGSCLTMSFPPGQATLYSGQTFYLRVRNLTSTFYGSDVGYSLRAEVVAPVALNTATPTVTPTPRPATGTATVTPTPTAAPVEQLVNPNRGGSYTNSNGDTDGAPPRYFTTGHDDGVDFSFQSSRGHNVFGFFDRLEGADRRSGLAVNGLNAVKVVLANTVDSATGDPITQFQLPVSFCVAFNLAELQQEGVDQNTMSAYYIDPNSGEPRTLGVARTSFTAATATTPGQICFKTTHFSSFGLYGNAVATATPPPTTPTPRTGTSLGTQLRLPRVFQYSGGW